MPPVHMQTTFCQALEPSCVETTNEMKLDFTNYLCTATAAADPPTSPNNIPPRTPSRLALLHNPSPKKTLGVHHRGLTENPDKTYCWRRQIKRGFGWFCHPKRFSQPGAATLLKRAVMGDGRWRVAVEGCGAHRGLGLLTSSLDDVRTQPLPSPFIDSCAQRQKRGLGGNRSTELGGWVGG